MADLSSGEYMISSIDWRKREEDSAFRPLRGFTTGKLYVKSWNTRIEARFNDQNLSNRLSDLEEDEVELTLQIHLLGEEEAYVLPGGVPTLERSGACYILRLKGKSSDVRVREAA